MTTRPAHGPLAAMLTSLPGDFATTARQAADLGFQHVDVVAVSERSPGDLEVLADTGLLVCCAAVGRGLPPGHTLDAEAMADRRAALEEMKRQVADAALLGATHCYVIPGLDSRAEGLARFADSCRLLADYAGQHQVRLCVEHFPRRALPEALGTLAWLEAVGHDNLLLLLDIGHCLISGEDAAAVVARAGSRLGYVHFDDNDGRDDLHWPLLTGRLTEPALATFLGSLRQHDYRYPLALEFNSGNPDPVGALRQGKALLERLAARP